MDHSLSLPVPELRGINYNYNEKKQFMQQNCLPQAAGEAKSLHRFSARPDTFTENKSMDYY